MRAPNPTRSPLPWLFPPAHNVFPKTSQATGLGDAARERFVADHAPHAALAAAAAAAAASSGAQPSAHQQHPEVAALTAWLSRAKAGEPGAGAAYAGRLPRELLHTLFSGPVDTASGGGGDSAHHSMHASHAHDHS